MNSTDIQCKALRGIIALNNQGVSLLEKHCVEQAIDQANALPVAFQAAVFATDIDAATGIAGKLDASAVMINDHTAFRDDVMPFAGLRESGLGIGGIPYTMHDMSIDKMTVIKSPGFGP